EVTKHYEGRYTRNWVRKTFSHRLHSRCRIAVPWNAWMRHHALPVPPTSPIMNGPFCLTLMWENTPQRKHTLRALQRASLHEPDQVPVVLQATHPAIQAGGQPTDRLLTQRRRLYIQRLPTCAS